MLRSELQRLVLSNSILVGLLQRTGPGLEWRALLSRLENLGLVHDVLPHSADSVVVGHHDSFAPLEAHLKSTVKNSYKLTCVQPIVCQTLLEAGMASAEYVTATCSADHYATVSLEAWPSHVPNSINLRVERSDKVSPELHNPLAVEAIMDGCLMALLQRHAYPIVALEIIVTQGEWNQVDSRSGDFRKVAQEAMLKIINSARLVVSPIA